MAITQYTAKQFSILRKWNIIAGILHLVQGLIMWFLSNDSTRAVYISLPEPDIALRRAFPVFEKIGDYRLGPVIASFLFLSAIAHFIVVIPAVTNWYNANIKNHVNIARWIEYALSSSIMLVVVALLSNVIDFNILLLVFVLNACMNLFGMSMERYNSISQQLNPQNRIDWSNYIFGVIAGLTPWIVIGTYFFVTLDRVEGQGVEIPEFVKYIFYTLIVTFNTFAINMFLQYKKIGPWKDYIFGEKVYIILSLTAKTILAWQIFGGTLR